MDDDLRPHPGVPAYPYAALPMAPDAAPAANPGPARRRARYRVLRSLLALVAVVGLVAAGWWLRSGEAPSLPLVTQPTTAPVEAPRTVPAPGFEQADEPLGTPPPAPDSDSFGFIARQADGTTPVAYDPCRPVDVVLATDGAPAEAEALLTDALDRMTEVTGLQFRYAGPTDELPGSGRAAYQPDRYGDRWAPVLVGWRTPEQEPALAGEVAGLGGSASAGPAGGPLVYVTGSVTLDGPEYADLLADGDTELARAILLHELGHVVGLAHVWDETQLMAATTRGGVLDFADGDLAGLAVLGAGACVPEV
ncbi:peptidase [Klenkia sp. LSe6-5]|uniref:Peptidase n=1 Tax=Klenkia sesuvii TaxID=3103137 RepID=A0ABU8DY53_9ACTN